MFRELPGSGVIRIEGNDAKKFLQGQLTCDVTLASNGRAIMGAHCNREGRIISLFHLFLIEDAYYLLMQRSMIPIAISALKKYAVFFKAEITDVSVESKEQDSMQWKALMINEGIPVIYPETSGKFLPHEINLHTLNAISFNKGCYTGQEIIARMHYRGKLKNHMRKMAISSETQPFPGCDMYVLHETEWKLFGMVVDAIPQDNQYQLLVITDKNTEDKTCQIKFESSLRN
jgi:folate-binding protein YgfZ